VIRVLDATLTNRVWINYILSVETSLIILSCSVLAYIHITLPSSFSAAIK